MNTPVITTHIITYSYFYRPFLEQVSNPDADTILVSENDGIEFNNDGVKEMFQWDKGAKYPSYAIDGIRYCLTLKYLHWLCFYQRPVTTIFGVYWCGWWLSLTWTGMITIVDSVYIWRWLCVSFTFKISLQCTCVLNIVNFICCWNIYYSGSESPERRKICKLYFKGFGVSHENKTREEDGSDVLSKDNNIDRKPIFAKYALCND